MSDMEPEICKPHRIEDCPFIDNIVRLESAFPDGPENHAAYHAKLIRATEAQQKFWEDLSTDLKKKGIKSLVLILVGLIVWKLFGTDTVKLFFKLFV